MIARSTLVAAVTLTLTACAFAKLPKGQSTDPLANLQGGDNGPDPAEVMKAVANGMDDVHGFLADYQTDAPVQTKEKEVADNLDSIIKALEKQCSGNGGASTSRNQPPR